MVAASACVSCTQYVPRLLLRYLEDERHTCPTPSSQIEGVVLVVDPVNSTGLTDTFGRSNLDGSEHLAKLLNRYFGGLIDIVAAHRGDTLRVDADALIAIWHDAAGQAEMAVQAAPAAIALNAEDHAWRSAGTTYLPDTRANSPLPERRHQRFECELGLVSNGRAIPEDTCTPKGRSRRRWPGGTHKERTDEHGETG